MSSKDLELFLTELYLDANTRVAFLENPRREAQKKGLSEVDCSTLEKIDRVGLELAAESFKRKREQKGKFPGKKSSFIKNLFQFK